jgi:hypothetical protein
MKYFVQWLIIFSLILLGIGVAWYHNVAQLVNTYDFTKLSFVILAMFLFWSVKIGIKLFQGNLRSIYPDTFDEDVVFFADMFTKIGFIGTIAGFIYALFYTFFGLDISNIAQVQTSLVAMGIGMATAMFTTITGLICSVLLRIQLYIYEKKF